MGCSLSAPATGGCSVVSAVLMYAAGSEKEKQAGDRLHGDTIAQSFVFCKGGGGWQGPLTPASARRWGQMVLSWPDPPSGEGLAWRAPLSHLPTLQRLGYRGTPPVPPAGAAPPAPRLRDGGSVVACALLQWGDWLGRGAIAPHRPPTFSRTGGHAVPPAGAALPAPRLRDGGSVVACALLQWGVWLGLRRYPARTTLQRFWVQGDSPCTLLGAGMRGGVVLHLGASGRFLACPCTRGQGQRAAPGSNAAVLSSLGGESGACCCVVTP